MSYNPVNSQYSNIVMVSSLDDFPDPVGSRIKLDATKAYLIDGVIDLGTLSLEIPEAGASVAALFGARDVSVLKSSVASHKMFVSPVGGFSGPVVGGGFTITSTGANSKIFDLDNDENGNAIDLVNLNFVNCVCMGDLTSYRQLLLNNVGFIFIEDGLQFNGTWSGGIAILTAIAIGFPAATLFKEGTSLVIQGSVRSDINFLSVNASSELFDFQASNITADGGLSLTNVRTTATDAMPNLAGANVKARYRDCLGIRDTYVGGQLTIGTAAATDLSTAGQSTLLKMAGTTTYGDLQWFSNTVDNAFVYDSTQEIEIDIQLSMSFSGTNNDVLGVQIRQWDNSASAYVNVGARFTATLNSAGRAENVSVFARAVMNKDDRIEVWIENQTAARDITATLGGFVGIEERPS